MEEAVGGNLKKNKFLDWLERYEKRGKESFFQPPKRSTPRPSLSPRQHFQKLVWPKWL